MLKTAIVNVQLLSFKKETILELCANNSIRVVWPIVTKYHRRHCPPSPAVPRHKSSLLAARRPASQRSNTHPPGLRN